MGLLLGHVHPAHVMLDPESSIHGCAATRQPVCVNCSARQHRLRAHPGPFVCANLLLCPHVSAQASQARTDACPSKQKQTGPVQQ